MVFIIVLLTFFIFALAIMWRPSTVLAFAVCIYPFEQWAQANIAYFAQNSARKPFKDMAPGSFESQ